MFQPPAACQQAITQKLHLLQRDMPFTHAHIQPDAGGPNIFLHTSAVERLGLKTLTKGTRIRFRIGRDRKGVCAMDLQLI